MSNSDKTHINVALIGLEVTTAAFVQGTIKHAMNKQPAPGQFPEIGGYDAKSIRFSSAFTLTPELDREVGYKLSEAVFADAINPRLTPQSSLQSFIEMQGGNPNTDPEATQQGVMMGGQNPILRNMPVNRTNVSEDEDNPEIETSFNEQSFRTILSGEDSEGDVNPYRKTDVAIISLPEDDSIYRWIDIREVISILNDMGIPHYLITEGDMVPHVEPVDNVPFVEYDLVGQVGSNFITQLVKTRLDDLNLDVSHDSIRQIELPNRRTRVDGLFFVKGFGGVEAQISHNITFDTAAANAASLFDVVRFLAVANELNLAEHIRGVEQLYTANPDTHMRTNEAEDECQSIAERNLMALGQFYKSNNNNQFVHK